MFMPLMAAKPRCYGNLPVFAVKKAVFRYQIGLQPLIYGREQLLKI